jgi:hypothetical protein
MVLLLKVVSCNLASGLSAHAGSQDVQILTKKHLKLTCLLYQTCAWSGWLAGWAGMNRATDFSGLAQSSTVQTKINVGKSLSTVN